MTERIDVESTAQDLLDALLPRRSPQYAPALAYLSAYLGTDAATRRLAMRALKASSAPEPDTGPAGPATSGPEAEDPPEGLPPEAPGRSDEPRKMLERQSRPEKLASPSLPECGGKLCEVKGGVTIHKQDPSCAKFNGKRAVRG